MVIAWLPTSCIGLAVSDGTELAQLVTAAHRSARQIGAYNGVHVARWQDDSGAALILGWRSGELLDLIPAYTAASGGLLSGCHLINESIASAAVVDAEGEQLTAMAFDAEQYRQLQALGQPVSGPARITALGVAAEIYQDDDAFAASPGSLLDPTADPAREPPQHYLDRGWTWPPRVASESFFSYGAFGEPAQASAHARLSGTVLKANRTVCTLTGQPFTIASVRTTGFEADLCLAGSEHSGLPVPGNIISGTVYLSATIDASDLKPESELELLVPLRYLRPCC